MVFCTYCGREFGRNEHLERHVRTHTKVRPYRCTICHVSFTRLDLLQKHYHSHSQEERATVRNLVDVPQPEGRRAGTPMATPRNNLACNNCAKSKIRCDHGHPCGRCKARGLVCESRASKRARGSFPDVTIGHSITVQGNLSADGHHILSNELGIEQMNAYFDPSQKLDEQQTPNIFHGPQNFDDNSQIVESPSSKRTDSVMSPVEARECPPNNHDDLYLNNNFQSNNEVLQLPTGPSSAASQTVPGGTPDPQMLDADSRIIDTQGWVATETCEVNSYSPAPSSTNLDQFLPQTNYTNLAFPGAPSEGAVMNYHPSILPEEKLTPDGNNMDNTYETSLFALDLIFDQFPRPMVNSTNFMPVDTLTHDETGAVFGSLQGFSPQFPDTGLDDWNLCRCIPQVKTVATSNEDSDIFDLDTSCNDLSSWSKSAYEFRQETFQPFEHISHATLTETTREWMLMVIQSFLRIALESRGLKIKPHSPQRNHPPEFIFLPPNNSLHRYLEIFLTTYDPFYPMVPALSLNPNKLANSSNERGATLLLLLMVALGSMLDPSAKARSFSFALSEICRHSLADIFAENSSAYKSSLNLQCAFLFVIGAAFSGRKMHMDMAVGQKALCLTMMRHSHFFQPRSPVSTLFFSSVPSDGSVDSIWKAWIDRETASRLACCWIIADQEISLFYDSPPSLALSELDIPLPCDEKLWLAPSAAKWKTLVSGTGPGSTEAMNTFLRHPQLSLHKLFLQITESRSNITGSDFQLLHMRLALYPIQILVSHLRQLLRLVGSGTTSYNFPACIIQSSLTVRFDELHRLLSRWFDLFDEVHVQGIRSAALMQSTTVLYHLIHLNLLTSFSDLEAFARGERRNSNPDLVCTIEEDWFQEPEAVLVHCGQVLKLIRGIDKKLRPNWWAAAVYRITIIMWAWGVSHRGRINNSGIPEPSQNIENIVLNSASFRDPSITSYLRNHRGNPCIKTKSGALVSLTDPEATLSECIMALEAGPKMCRFTMGVLHRIEAMAKAWEPLHEKTKLP